MIFNEDYWRTADRRAAQYVEVSPRQIGVSTFPVRDQLQELKSKIFAGASNVELGFFGRGKGSRAQGQITPEMFGKEEREAMRNMAKVNEVGLTTHASANVMGFSGVTERGFDKNTQEAALHEVERAIDFAADTAEGGPVVVHAAEFPRPIFETEEEKFEAYPKEVEKAPVYLVDKRTGEMTMLRRDMEVSVPIPVLDEYGNPRKDEQGRPIYERDEYTGQVKFVSKKFSQFEEDYNQLPEEEKAKYNYDPGKYFYNKYMERELELSRGEQGRWDSMARREEKSLKALRNLRESYERLRETAEDKEYVKTLLINRMQEARLAPSNVADPEGYRDFLDNPEKYLGDRIRDVEIEIKSVDEVSLSYGRGASQIEERMNKTVPIKEYGIEQSADTIARAGIAAFDRERAQGLKKPLFVAPENVFPESGYGAHPQELKNLILKSRDAMANKLVAERKISKEQAEDIAKEHIKATFDIGHAYTWKKFFKRQSGETEEQAEKRFRNWIKGQVDDLTKEGIIGHVHLSDNFGYYDEHLTPGEGSVPIKEFVKRMQLAGFKKPMVVEPGALPEAEAWRTMTGTWRTLNAPIYRIDGMRSWTDIDRSYFGHTGAVTYVVGEYAPSKDWTLWSEVQLE